MMTFEWLTKNSLGLAHLDDNPQAGLPPGARPVRPVRSGGCVRRAIRKVWSVVHARVVHMEETRTTEQDNLRV